MKKRELIVIFFFSLVAILSACTPQSTSDETIHSTTIYSSEGSTTSERIENAPDSLWSDSYFKELYSDGQNPKVIFEQLYDVDWHDKDWTDVDFSIDRVKIVEVDSFEISNGQKYRGLIAVRYDLRNDSKQDISIYPETTNVVLTDDKMIEAMLYLERWDNVFSVNKYTDGLIYFLLEDIENLKNAKELEIQFNVKSRSDSSLDKRTYQAKLPLVLTNDDK